MTPAELRKRAHEALAALAFTLYKYSGLGPLHINDLRPELDALICAAKDEEAEECAAALEESISRKEFINTEDIWTAKILRFGAETVRARIAARAKGEGA